MVLFRQQEVMVAGGMESMSNVPFLVGRDPPKYGGHTMEVGYYSTEIAIICSQTIFCHSKTSPPLTHLPWLSVATTNTTHCIQHVSLGLAQLYKHSQICSADLSGIMYM